MQTYTAPLRDMRFVLHELIGTDSLTSLPGCAELTPDLTDPILEEAAKLAHEVLAPTNMPGDAEGCVWENGVVRTPDGIKRAYNAFRDGGWTSLTADAQWGGQALPESIHKLVEEMICSANLSFSLYPGLTNGACHLLRDHASEEIKQRYLPPMVEGRWSGTMNLTEPHCGTDLGMLRTRAEPQTDGSYRITGNKIFISAGEHDLTENIVHLVLARLPGAPAGTKGISLFLVPKFLVNDDGALGARNGVFCTAIEHKHGLRASATCQMSYENAVGWLIGEPHKGLRAMFTMMNNERVAVGMQGLGVGEAAYQSAVAYARERLQGRSLSGAKRPDQQADPIIVHPDIRRTLMTMRAWNEGSRALAGWVARELDIVERHPDRQRRAEAEEFAALMTPVVKALLTDIGYETASSAMQIYGGHGYICDHGVEQYLRDARIAMIYEGTNGVQALDLVGRKMGANMGRSLRHFFHPVADFIAANQSDKLVAAFAKAFAGLQRATAGIAMVGLADPEEAGAAATEYLRLFGIVAVGYLWLRAAKLARAALDAGSPDAAFYQAKLVTARFYIERILPQAGALLAQIEAGKAAMMAMEEAAF
jgi:alkylation response protein AidB-like acyl-CoA dehydrogenase